MGKRRVVTRPRAGTVQRIPFDLRERFPLGTIVTKDGDRYTAHVPVSKTPSEPTRIVDIIADPGEDQYVLCRRVREYFRKPVDGPESHESYPSPE